MQRNSKPMTWRGHGLSDTEDASSTFNGAMGSLANLVPDPQTAKVWYCRPAATLIIDLNSAASKAKFAVFGSVYSSSGFISLLDVIGDIAYGMVAGGNGFDVPFTFNLQNSTLVLPTGVTASNVPRSPLSSGAWAPPQSALVGAKLIVTHPGFTGLDGSFFGWFDITNPVAPVWHAGNLTGAIAFTTAPSAVAQFNQRAYYITNVPSQPAVFFSDVLNPTNVTNGNQILTFGDNSQLTVLSGLPLFNQLGGVVQSLMVFKDETNVYQVTGDALTNNLSINSLNLATGTRAANSLANTPKGLAFISPEGLRLIDFYARISDPVGYDGNGVTSPFSLSVIPSRINAACNGSLLRITTQNGAIAGGPTQEFWYDVTRQIWSGPHTSTFNMVAPWRGTFVISPTWNNSALYQSDTIQSNTSTFVEHGQPLSWVWQTPLLPDTDEMTDVCITETTLDMAFAPMATAQATFSDQTQTVLDTVYLAATGTATIWGQFNWGTGTWGGTSNPLAPIRMPWHLPLTFSRGSFSATGQSAAQMRIGALHLRYQQTRHWVNPNLTLPVIITDEFGNPLTDPSGNYLEQ